MLCSEGELKRSKGDFFCLLWTFSFCKVWLNLLFCTRLLTITKNSKAANTITILKMRILIIIKVKQLALWHPTTPKQWNKNKTQIVENLSHVLYNIALCTSTWTIFKIIFHDLYIFFNLIKTEIQNIKIFVIYTFMITLFQPHY